MIEFHGKPFLAYLLELLREQGFRRVLLLLGYLHDVVRSYFGDGERYGLTIEYSVADVGDETGQRLRLARSQIEPIFLLMYCDNYWPMDIARLWRYYLRDDVAGLLTVYRNDDHYTRDNVRIDDDGYVVVYDKSRTAPDLRGVDIGFGILRRQVLDLLPEGNVSFEEVVYPELVKRRQLRAFVTDHRYYSVSSHDRLPASEAFLARRPAVIIDRDGVLNEKPARAEYVRSWADWRWLPGAREALRLLKESGYRVLVVSNQAGVGRGVMSEADLVAIHERMKAEARQAGGEIAAVYYCPHNWSQGCTCRKPRPGMLFRAQRDFGLDLSRTLFIGDDERDGRAAAAAGCAWARVSDDMSLLDVTRKLLAGATSVPAQT